MDDDDTAFERRMLRKSCERFGMSEADIGAYLDAHRSVRAQRTAEPPVDESNGPIAMVRGDENDMRLAAEALHAMNRGEEVPKDLPANIVINPSKEQIEASRKWRGHVFITAQAEPLWRQQPVSLVMSATETKTYPTTIGDALAGIRAGKWEKPVKRIRDAYAKAFKAAEEDGKPDPSLAAKKAVHRLKAALSGITFSGTFSVRKDDALEAHSGFLCIDVDQCGDCVEMRAKVAGDPYVQAAFVSPTGTGLKVLIRINPDKDTHLASFAAARKHFLEAYEVSIDEACKDLSRLCYVAHDPDAFVRDGAAKVLAPLEPEQPVQQDRDEEKAPSKVPNLEGLIILPKDGMVSYTMAATAIFNKIVEHQPPELFLRAGTVVAVKETVEKTTGEITLSIEDVSPDAFRAALERYGTVFAWRKGQHGENVLTTHGLMSHDVAKVMLACEERLRLPPLSMVHRAPVLIERDGGDRTVVVLERGYHRILGGRWIASSGKIVKMSIDEAVRTILELFDEFHFSEEADKSRAIVSLIMPALRFGGLLRCHFPALLVEADQSQAGKGALVDIIKRIYGEVPGMTAKRKGGVGSFDEELSQQFLWGRPFIPIDNIRDSLDSEFFEMCLTCPIGGTVSARVPHKASVLVDPNKHIFHLTSNRFESTQDLANRACVVRIRKRAGYSYKKFPDGHHLEEHVEKNPWPCLSAVFSIVARWVKEGKPRNEDELRNDGKFREYWQVGDWFARKIFTLPAPLDGHEKIQRRVASAGQTWVRAMGNLVQVEGRLNEELSASQLVDIAEEADEGSGVQIPGLAAKATTDEKHRRVGIIMKQLFKNGSSVDVDTFHISRTAYEEERPGHGIETRKFYVFSQNDKK